MESRTRPQSDREHGYIPLDPDIDQTSPDPLRLQCRSLGKYRETVQGLIVRLEENCRSWADTVQHLRLSLAVSIQLLAAL